jgi:hypothetical protein
MGKKFSKTLRQQPWLEMPPNDKCIHIIGNNSLLVTADPLSNLTTTKTLLPNISNVATMPIEEYTPYLSQIFLDINSVIYIFLFHTVYCYATMSEE